MAMQVHEMALSIVQALGPMMPSIQRHDRALAVQLRNAANSMVLNIAESEYSDPATEGLGSSPRPAPPTSRDRRCESPSLGAISEPSEHLTYSLGSMV